MRIFRCLSVVAYGVAIPCVGALLGALVREGFDLSIWGVKNAFGWTNDSNDTFRKQLLDSLEDMTANMRGMEVDPLTPCEQQCCEYKVNGL